MRRRPSAPLRYRRDVAAAADDWPRVRRLRSLELEWWSPRMPRNRIRAMLKRSLGSMPPWSAVIIIIHQSAHHFAVVGFGDVPNRPIFKIRYTITIFKIPIPTRKFSVMQLLKLWTFILYFETKIYGIFCKNNILDIFI